MIIETTIAFILIFSVLVVFHEFGHFIVAKLSGIKVEEFSLGMGPRIVRLAKIGDTEYTIHAFPIGGFVKLTGMEPGEEDIPDGFQAQALWKRALTIFAGPFASFVLAVLVFLGIGMYWGFPGASKRLNQIGMVTPQSEAARIGLRAGDVITKVNGQPVTGGDELTAIIHRSPGKSVALTVKRNGNVVLVRGVPSYYVQFADASWMFPYGKQATVKAVDPKSDSAKPKLAENDKLISINGRQVGSGKVMLDAIAENGGKPMTMVVRRGDTNVSISVKQPAIAYVSFLGARWMFPGGYAIGDDYQVAKKSAAGRIGIEAGDILKKLDGQRIVSGDQMLKLLADTKSSSVRLTIDRDGKKREIIAPVNKEELAKIDSSYYESMGILGFMPAPALVRTGFVGSVKRGLSDTGLKIGYLVKSLTSSKIKEDVGGPLMIVKMTSSSVALGPYWVLDLLGGLSLSLSIINLLPIPVLDGGHLFILAVEAVRRKRLTAQQMQIAMGIGLGILGILIIAIVASDLFKITHGLVPQ